MNKHLEHNNRNNAFSLSSSVRADDSRQLKINFIRNFYRFVLEDSQYGFFAEYYMTWEKPPSTSSSAGELWHDNVMNGRGFLITRLLWREFTDGFH